VRKGLNPETLVALQLALSTTGVYHSSAPSRSYERRATQGSNTCCRSHASNGLSQGSVPRHGVPTLKSATQAPTTANLNILETAIGHMRQCERLDAEVIREKAASFNMHPRPRQIE
jgi:hypothetical protein